MTGLLASGRNGGTWNGAGIDTGMSDAAAGNTTLAIAEASQVFGIANTQTASFGGEAVDATSVLIKYTYGGDANLDGKFNIDDYVKIDTGIAAAVTGWSNGDFNYDGKVNIDDYVIIDSHVGTQGPPFSNGSGHVDCRSCPRHAVRAP